ncbi:SulP family inorganic anion transporter [Salsipaludibacter albus]|uniref:SulP family inorganic anion transporter n=1 Tax=Salsipaludibacter albus TaxID=2849650 RepID=UPI001EE4D13D|nr:SulP family inorganic anion transporter [Salsipaludibacter albus]MBY5161311.1 SulP family inorganic anion transporter [Salsipaludibacter albus]
MTKSRSFAVLEGLRPLDASQVPRDVVAGITLAALAIPEVMGYATIAGMPVITGLYSIVLPVFVFALLGSSRHLVVGADSATAAILAAGIGGMATSGSSDYVAMAGVAALITGLFLFVARFARLGFIADFLSRTVLIGFLTGVGIQVALGQVPDMFGLEKVGSGPLEQLWNVATDLASASWPTVALSVAIIVVVKGGRLLSTKIPWPLLAVVGAIVASAAWDFADNGISTLGTVPGGLPSLTLPTVAWSDVGPLAGVSVSLFVVILAQSAATSRAYAAKYDETVDEDTDLVGLGMANVAAGVTGTFVVNGSPTKTQMVDTAGGRTQVANLSMGVVVVVVLLFLTGPLQYLPNAVLAAVVFLIGLDLVDLAGMRRILAVRRDEFWVATVTAAAVVFVGVLPGILLAIFLSIVIHMRLSYKPHDTLLETGEDGHVHVAELDSRAELIPGLIVYRFGHSLYYANANQFAEEVTALVDTDDPPQWVCLEASAIADVDYTAAETIRQVHDQLAERDVRLVVCNLTPDVQAEIGRFGTLDLLGTDAVFDTVNDVEEHVRRAAPTA